MAEENAASRSEAPTTRRRLEARRQGITPRSVDLTVFCVLLLAAGAAFFYGPDWVGQLRSLLADGLSGRMPWPALLRSAVGIVLPPLLLIFVAQLAAPLLLSGWVFAPAQFEFRLSRIVMLRGFLRPLQWAGFMDFLKALAKLAVLVAAVYWLAKKIAPLPAAWFVRAPALALPEAGTLLTKTALILAAALALPALLDALEQWWRHWRRLRMSRDEILAETREAEVSPALLARLRERAAERRGALLEDEA